MELVKIKDLAQLLALADDDSFVIGSGDNAQRITWAKLKALMSNLYSDVNAVSTHNASDTAHEDIRDLIAEMVIDLRDEASSHNSSGMAHADIRKLIEELAAEHSHLTQSKANAIVSKLNGNTAVATDSAKAGFEGLRIFGRSEQGSTTGKNLLQNQHSPGNYTDCGITYTTNADGSITANGTATDHSSYLIVTSTSHPEIMSVLAENEVILSGTPKNTNGDEYRVQFWSSQESHVDRGGGAQFKIEKAITSWNIAIYVTPETTLNNVTFYPMLRLASVTDDTYEPYTGGIASPNPDYPQEIVSVGDGGSVGVDVCGKNLLPNNAVSLTKNGVTFTVNEDRSITVNGTATGLTYYQIIFGLAMTSDEGYILSGCPSGGSAEGYALRVFKPDLSKYYTDFGDGVTIKDAVIGGAEIRITSGATVTNITFYPMLRLASVEDDTYEPYQKQSSIFTTPNGLPGIKVTDSSLATYTDENGQMWCADEVDLGRGVYVQRIFKKILTGDEHYGSSGQTLYMIVTNIIGEEVMSNSIYSYADKNHLYGGYAHGIAGNPAYNQIFIRIPGITTVDALTAMVEEKYNNGTPVEIHYILATPIETPLSTEEIAAYKALHTNYPTTTVMNDCGADMEVEYVADPANHISQNYVPKASYTELEARVSALEQLAINS